jgi:pilus assembly protein CpaC
MYANLTRRTGRARLVSISLIAAAVAVFTLPSTVAAQQPASVVRNITEANERLEMTVNTSQILTLGTRIPRLVVNNPELVTATPISDTQVQIAARKPGVTQINLWDENGQVYTVDLLIFGDVRELELALKHSFPGSSIKVIRLTNSLVLEGQVDRPEIVSTIRSLAEDYAPKVINNITVGGVQQVMLKVKVMEVSRTKLRKMGADFAAFGSGGFFVSSASDIIQTSSSAAQTATALSTGETITFGVIDDGTSFLGFLDLLQQNNVSKILADPTLVTVSGRPAFFNVGGELPILVPSGLGQTTIEYKKFGTQVDFLPIVLGNGRIRLEVRPRLSEIDDTRSVTVNSFVVPALKVREVDTGVEMQAGQTLALAGLIQERIEASHRGLPFVSDLPLLGIPFRKVQEQVNEIENLILVTPEFADAMDPHEVPPCGPGMETMSPSHCDLYCKGMIEVPACGPCGASDPCSCNAPGLGCQTGNCGPAYGGAPGGPVVMATDGGASAMAQPLELYGGLGREGDPEPIGPTPAPMPVTPQPQIEPQQGQVDPQPSGAALPDPSANIQRAPWQRTAAALPVFPRNQYNPATAEPSATPATSTPGLIGPIGYDVQK